MDLGFERAGFSIGYINEIHSPFLAAYKFARENIKMNEPEFGYHEGNIEEILEEKKKAELVEAIHTVRKKGNLVGIIGGPPCPDFSIGGKNKGRTGDQGKLSSTYFEIIALLKPDFFLFGCFLH